MIRMESKARFFPWFTWRTSCAHRTSKGDSSFFLHNHSFTSFPSHKLPPFFKNDSSHSSPPQTSWQLPGGLSWYGIAIRGHQIRRSGNPGVWLESWVRGGRSEVKPLPKISFQNGHFFGVLRGVNFCWSDFEARIFLKKRKPSPPKPKTTNMIFCLCMNIWEYPIPAFATKYGRWRIPN